MRRFLLFSLLFASACHRHHKQVVVPPPPLPAPQANPPVLTRRPAPASPQRRATAPTVPAQPASPAQTPPPPQLHPAPAPLLVPSLTAEQRDAALQSIDIIWQRTQAVLARAERATLSTSQQSSVARIQSFLKQAQATRATDLPAARGFAERADALAQDLAKSLP